MTTCKAFKNCSNEATTTTYQTFYFSNHKSRLMQVPCCRRCANELNSFAQFAEENNRKDAA